MAFNVTIEQLFTPTVLAGSKATIYQNPTSPSTTVLVEGRVRLANTTGGAVAVTPHKGAVEDKHAVGHGAVMAFLPCI